MQSSASGCFDLLYKHFNYIKHMGRRWPSMPRDYISPMIRTLIKWTIFQETKGSDYLTMLTLGQKKHLYPRFMGLIHLWMSICIMQNAWFSVFLSHKPIHWLQKLINEHQFLWTFTCTHREQNFQPEFIFVNTWHQSRSPQVLAAAVDQIIPGTSNAFRFLDSTVLCFQWNGEGVAQGWLQWLLAATFLGIPAKSEVFSGVIWVWVNTYRYIFNGMNIHKSQLFWGSPGVPGFWPIPIWIPKSSKCRETTLLPSWMATSGLQKLQQNCVFPRQPHQEKWLSCQKIWVWYGYALVN